MKKLFTTLALSGAFWSIGNAQSADLSLEIIGMSDSIIKCDGTEFIVAYKITNNGPGTISAGDKIGLQTPTNMPTQAWILNPSEDFASGDTIVVTDTFTSDIVKSLYIPGTGLVEPPYTVGSDYGVFGSVAPFDDSDWTDPVDDNNGMYSGVKWCSATSVGSLKGLSKQQIAVYPNPTSNDVNFTYSFDKASATAVARILDVTGKVVMTHDFGKQFAGEQRFKLNVGSLPAGMYTLEFVAEENRGISKFTVK